MQRELASKASTGVLIHAEFTEGELRSRRSAPLPSRVIDMTIKATLATIRAGRMSASCRDGEYRVSYPAHEVTDATQREDSAYYTDCAEDAISTAQDMRRREDGRRSIAEAIETNRRG